MSNYRKVAFDYDTRGSTEQARPTVFFVLRAQTAAHREKGICMVKCAGQTTRRGLSRERPSNCWSLRCKRGKSRVTLVIYFFIGLLGLYAGASTLRHDSGVY